VVRANKNTSFLESYTEKDKESLRNLTFLSILYMVAFLSEATRQGSFYTQASSGRWAPS
jgi:hypothetical protein